MHKIDCPCPVCTYRRRGQGKRTPLRSIRLRDEVWEWLKTRAGGASGWIERYATEVMQNEVEQEARDKERAIRIMHAHERHATAVVQNEVEQEASDKEKAIRIMQAYGWTRPLR